MYMEENVSNLNWLIFQTFFFMNFAFFFASLSEWEKNAYSHKMKKYNSS